MTTRTERVTIPVSDGTSMNGHLVIPEGEGPKPAILLYQEIFGVNDHMRRVAARYAELGYIVLAPDLFHRQVENYEAGYDNIGDSIAVAMKYSAEQSEADLRASYDFISKHPQVKSDRVAALGFCMGGRLSFVSNGVSPLRCAISFYGNIAPDKLSFINSQSGHLLLIWAGKDAYIPAENVKAAVDACKGAGKAYTSIEFSENNHGFFCDARSDYEAGAASQAWALTSAFLKTHLG